MWLVRWYVKGCPYDEYVSSLARAERFAARMYRTRGIRCTMRAI